MQPQQVTKPASAPDNPSPLPRELHAAARKGYLRVTAFTNSLALENAWLRLCAHASLPAIVLSRHARSQWPRSNTAIIQVIGWSEPDPENSELAQLRGVKEVLADQWGTIVWAQDRYSARIARQLAKRFRIGTVSGGGRPVVAESAPVSSPPVTQEASNAA